MSVVFSGYTGSWAWTDYNEAVYPYLKGTGTSATLDVKSGEVNTVTFGSTDGASQYCVVVGI